MKEIFKVRANSPEGWKTVGHYSRGTDASHAVVIWLMWWAIDEGIYTVDNIPIPHLSDAKKFNKSDDGMDYEWIIEYGGWTHWLKAKKILLDSKFIFAPDDPILRDRACQPK